MNARAWWDTIHEVTKSWTPLSMHSTAQHMLRIQETLTVLNPLAIASCRFLLCYLRIISSFLIPVIWNISTCTDVHSNFILLR